MFGHALANPKGSGQADMFDPGLTAFHLPPQFSGTPPESTTFSPAAPAKVSDQPADHCADQPADHCATDHVAAD